MAANENALRKNTRLFFQAGKSGAYPGKAQKLLDTAAFLALAAALLLFPQQVRASVGGSILYCLTVLTPSLFPFMALTSFAVNSSAGNVLGKGLGLLSRYVFRLPKVCTASILMSFLGGYPAGAKGASLLLEQGKISKKEAGRMMLFCINPGTAFVITYLGCAVLGSPRTGWLLFFSIAISGVLLGFFSGLSSPIPKDSDSQGKQPAGSPLVRSVTDASSAVVKMCACIVLFSGFTAILHGAGIYQALSRLLASTGLMTPMEASASLSFLIEVTGGVGDAARFRVSPSFYAFGLAFGGLCVHLQVFSFFPVFPVSKWKFFLFRFLHGGLSVAVYQALLHLLPGRAAEAFSWTESAGFSRGGFSTTLAGGLSLFLMCLAFLLIAVTGRERDCTPKEKGV